MYSISRTNRLLVFALLLGWVSAPAFAQDKDSEQKADPESKRLASQDPIAYFVGLSVGQDLLRNGLRGEDLDRDALLAGITDALSRNPPALSEDQLKSTSSDLQAKINKRQTEMLAQIRKVNLEKGEMWLEQNAKKEGVKELVQGIQYKVLKAGKGASPSESDMVKVHYTGQLISGNVFDSSVQRGEPAQFQIGRVIEGWKLALQKMKVGDKWMIYIPSGLAYGVDGMPRAGIGPNEVLVFEVELLDII